VPSLLVVPPLCPLPLGHGQELDLIKWLELRHLLQLIRKDRIWRVGTLAILLIAAVVVEIIWLQVILITTIIIIMGYIMELTFLAP